MTTQEYDHRFRMVRLVAEDDYLLFENSGTNDKGKWLLRARGDIPRILEFFGVIIVPGPGDFLYKLLRCEIIEKIGEVL